MKRAVLSKTGLVYLGTYIPLMIWIFVCKNLMLSLLAVLVWVLFWVLYNVYDYYNRWVKEAEG
jgi:hypothetical protein